MAAFVKIYSFVEAISEKVHNLGADTIVCALTPNATPPIQTNTQLTNLTPIAYTNLTGNGTAPGGRGNVATSSAQATGTYKLVLPDLVLTASGAVATFRWVALYNDTATNDELICYFDYGADVTLATGETFTLDFDGTNGLLQIV